MKLHFIQEQLSVEVPEGTTLLAAMRSAGIFLDAPCGGQGTCGKCLVFVREANDDPASSPAGHKLPEASGDPAQPKASVGNVTAEFSSFSSDSVKRKVMIEEAQEWRLVRACQERLSRSLWVDTKKGNRNQPQATCQILTSALGRQVPYRPLPFHTEELAAVSAGPYCMAAIDIGTTTLAAYLLNRETGRELCTASCLNPQAAYGADVISRADYTLTHGAQTLQDCIRQAVNDLIGTLAKKAAVSRESIVQLCLVGNTCMHHLFFGLPLDSLVRAPYVPSQKGLIREPAADLGIHIHPRGELLFLPVIAGFVGADTTGCLLAVRPDLSPDITLLIDIGTNGELVLGNRDRLVCCSTAAGPAFEGAKIECGMRGAAGAIDHVAYEPASKKFSYSVIGNAQPAEPSGTSADDLPASAGANSGHAPAPSGSIPDHKPASVSANPDHAPDPSGSIPDHKPASAGANPGHAPALAGICGSGLIDAIACLRKAGLADETGRLLSREEALALHGEALTRHIVRRGNQPAFLFDPDQPEVFLSQKDIREVQLAKAAIASGILLLERYLGIAQEQIRRVYLAGAFGSYMDPDSACQIGLLPAALRERIVPIGNAAGEGAKIALLNTGELQMSCTLSEQTEFLELAGIPEFQDCFVDELEFPQISG